MKNLNRYACISTIYGCENYKATQINIFILQFTIYLANHCKFGSGNDKKVVDAAIENLKCIFLKYENFGYHNGIQRRQLYIK